MNTQDALYAIVGAPVAAGKAAIEFARKGFAESAEEGRKAVKRFRSTEEMGLEQIQERVGKLRDQVEGALVNWRETFQPETKKPAPRKPAARKTAPKAKSGTKSGTKAATKGRAKAAPKSTKEKVTVS